MLEAFPISLVTIDPGIYDHKELQFVMFTNPNNKASFRNRTYIGGYFGGSRISSSNKVNLRLGDKFNAETNFNYNRLKLPNGLTNVVITGVRLAYSFTPRMFLQSLVQYNNVSEITSVNARFGWLKNANTGLFVVINIVKDNDFLTQLNNQSITIKYSYQFDLL